MEWPTPEQKFEMHWRFLEPEVRKLFFQMFKEGIVYAVSHKLGKKDEKADLLHKPARKYDVS